MIKKPDTLILSIAILCGISLSAQSSDTCITEILIECLVETPFDVGENGGNNYIDLNSLDND